MSITKGWDWQENVDQKWLVPSNEIYYLKSRWKDNKSVTFLDLGCGLGRHSILMSKDGFRVSAFDISYDGLAHLKKWSQKEEVNIDIRQGNMLGLPYDTSTFGCVLAYNVIYHTDTIGFEKALSEVSRVLKPGGELFLTLLSKNTWTWQQGDAGNKIDKNTILRNETEVEKNVPHFYVAYEDLKELFEDWSFIQNPVELTEYYDNGKFSTHWNILVSKKPE